MTGAAELDEDGQSGSPGTVRVDQLVKPCAWLCEYRNGEVFVSMAHNPSTDPYVKNAYPLVTMTVAHAMVAAERERIRNALLKMHEFVKQSHNYYACATVELFGPNV